MLYSYNIKYIYNINIIIVYRYNLKYIFNINILNVRHSKCFLIEIDLTIMKKSVKLYTDNVLEKFYAAIRDNKLDKLHIPHSDVYYVRAAVEAHYGRTFTLKHVETAMKAEGWKDS
jgi:hypothetical protein